MAQFKYCDNIDAQALIEYVVAYLKLSIIICDGIRFHFDPGMKVLIPLLTLQSKMNTDFKSLLSLPKFDNNGYTIVRQVEETPLDMIVHQRAMDLDWTNPASLVSVFCTYSFCFDTRLTNAETGMVMAPPTDDDVVKADIELLLASILPDMEVLGWVHWCCGWTQGR